MELGVNHALGRLVVVDDCHGGIEFEHGREVLVQASLRYSNDLIPVMTRAGLGLEPLARLDVVQSPSIIKSDHGVKV